MKKILLTLILIWSPVALAGQVVCPDTDGPVFDYGSGSPKSGCLYFELGKSGVDQTEYTRISELFKNVPRNHIKLVNGSPVEMSTEEKITSDSAETQTIRMQRRGAAKSYVESSNSPEMVALRSIIRVIYSSLAEVRGKNNLANRTWQQAIDSVKADIDAGNGEV